MILFNGLNKKKWRLAVAGLLQAYAIISAKPTYLHSMGAKNVRVP